MIPRLYAFAALFLCLFAISNAHAATITEAEVRHTNGMFGLRQSVYIDNRVLAANTAEAHTVPTDAAGVKANYVVFSATCDFYADFASTAVVPSADVTNGSGPELNPTVRFLANDVTTISLISPTACVVTMMFYK